MSSPGAGAPGGSTACAYPDPGGPPASIPGVSSGVPGYPDGAEGAVERAQGGLDQAFPGPPADRTDGGRKGPRNLVGAARAPRGGRAGTDPGRCH
jgi:hypothetical protein